MIEPDNTESAEIVMCRKNGYDQVSKKFSNCERGLAFTGDSEVSVSANIKSHPAGSTVVISDVGQFFNNYANLWDPEKIYGEYTYTTTTANAKLKLYFNTQFGDNYIWYNPVSDTMGFSTSSSEFAFNANGTTFTAIIPLTLTSGELKNATNTDEFVLDGSNNLSIRKNNSITSSADGLAVATTSPFIFNGSRTTTTNAILTHATTSDFDVTGNFGFSSTTGTMNFDNSNILGKASTSPTLSRNMLAEFLSDNYVWTYKGIMTTLGDGGAAQELTQSNDYITLKTGTVQNNKATIVGGGTFASTTKDWIFNAPIRLDGINQTAYWGLADNINDPVTFVMTQNHAVFMTSSTTLKASVGDGTTQTQSDDITGVDVKVRNRYKIERIGSNINFYVNNVLKTTLSTNLPIANNSMDISAYINNPADTTNAGLYVEWTGSFFLIQDPSL